MCVPAEWSSASAASGNEPLLTHLGLSQGLQVGTRDVLPTSDTDPAPFPPFPSLLPFSLVPRFPIHRNVNEE